MLGIKGNDDDKGVQIISMLIQAGASPDAKNTKGESPVSLCKDASTREFMKKYDISFSFPTYKGYSCKMSMCTERRRLSHLLQFLFVCTITKTCLLQYTENFTTKNENFQTKNSDIFHISAQNINCGYSIEPPHRKLKVFR